MTATLSVYDAAARRWDALVIGAGPAGSLTACLLARAGRSVLLVDKKPFPRYKVCGCCLNGWGLSSLEKAGLGGIATRLGAVELDLLCLASGRGRATLSLSRSVAVSRASLDAELAAAAIDSGAHFLPATAARPLHSEPDEWRVELKSTAATLETRASIIVAADGLAGRSADSAGPAHIHRRSRMGLGAIAADVASDYAPGMIHMGCAAHGYVGLVRLEDGRLNIGAAVDPASIKERTPAGAVEEILRACQMPPIDAVNLDWHGTPLLSRRRARVANHRLFALGDAAGYVEPFTGEGMAWALAAASALAPIASRQWSPELADVWQQTFDHLVARNWRRCSAMAWLLRKPNLTRAAIGTLNALPTLAAPMIRAIQTPEAAR